MSEYAKTFPEQIRLWRKSRGLKKVELLKSLELPQKRFVIGKAEKHSLKTEICLLFARN